ncbi:MAG: FMN-binding glutamate synthase family protein [Deltaproteobacteria bacterium]|nr:FMN-binding glutamate synthase family protein [Deltaproteobacteria bacterium]MBU47452.1 FMN-binding glutamate synthase family protein [Deltaproteobacteria bacterium]|tara:strand:+ start:1726 stop:3309 length:1584 start_codon:yes stop_codon:yes gene_type:complete
MRQMFVVISAIVVICIVAIGFLFPWTYHAFWVVGPLILLGFYDMTQTEHSILRNFPVIGHGRYLLEMVRPEINQYFVESNIDGTPFDRELRSIVYQRAKKELSTVPFGTQRNVYEVGYEWINHSMVPKPMGEEAHRILVGEGTCSRPYSASILNVSAMSYGSLSKNAVLALNGGAKKGGFAHNTGEGGVSPYHLEPGGDLIWQLGTGYFGACDGAGTFSLERFKETVAHEQIKMIEIKLSQGAKPGHGGILPAIKLTPEIAKIRGVPLGQDVLSPPGHSAFSTPIELCEFIALLRETADRPVGMKLCLGKRQEFLSFCKAMVKTGIHPDYIVVDGGEGGTGAAPLEFSNRVGCPLTEALVFVHNALVGIGLRDKIRVIASGKIVTGFDMVKVLALGADMCNSARAMMMALGCIQARRCHANDCPAGVATQKPGLVAGLHAPSKAERVYQYHHGTVESMMELVAAAGMESPDELRPWHIMRRTDFTKIAHYGELFEYIPHRCLVDGEIPAHFERAWGRATAESFSGQA